MKNKVIILLAVVLTLFLLKDKTLAGGLTPSSGDVFPGITFSIPEKEAEREYLGLTGKGSFRLSQIKADLLIVEIFSMYCPYCQREAPLVNDLYRIISEKPDLKKRIKIIGIGAGNTAFEVDVFRSQYDIRFPLFSDESFSAHKTLGEVRTPYFFVIKINADGSNRIIYSKVGTIQDPNQFLDLIIKESGLRQEGKS